MIIFHYYLKHLRFSDLNYYEGINYNNIDFDIYNQSGGIEGTFDNNVAIKQTNISNESFMIYIDCKIMNDFNDLSINHIYPIFEMGKAFRGLSLIVLKKKDESNFDLEFTIGYRQELDSSQHSMSDIISQRNLLLRN